MNEKRQEAIKHELRDRFNQILYCINNEALKEIVKNHCFIAGGAVRSLIDKKTINDIDLYFTSEKEVKAFKTFFQLFNGFGKREFDNHNTILPLVSETENSLTFNQWGQKGKPLQFILKFSGTPEQVINKFDFTNCMGYYIPQNDTLVVPDKMMKAIESKTLEYNMKSFNPVTSLARVHKFKAQGYKISKYQHAKLIFVALLTNSWKEVWKSLTDKELHKKKRSY